MAQYGLMIDYEWCTGCHSCEVACRNEHGFSYEQFGIKMTQVGPFEYGDRQWEFTFVPVPTGMCDLCEERVGRGLKPTCVHHCQALCMEYGTLEELTKKMAEKGHKCTLFLP